MARRLPSLNALRAFEAFSRHGRMTLAAEELGLTHGAVSRQVRNLGIRPVIARSSTEHGTGLDTRRWVVEAAFALLHWFRRLRIRWEIRADLHQAFLTSAARSSAGDA